jgi:hypothetical protein
MAGKQRATLGDLGSAMKRSMRFVDGRYGGLIRILSPFKRRKGRFTNAEVTTTDQLQEILNTVYDYNIQNNAQIEIAIKEYRKRK